MQILSELFASPCECIGESMEALQKQIETLNDDNAGLLRKIEQLTNDLQTAKKEVIECKIMETNLFEPGDIVKISGLSLSQKWNGKIGTILEPFQSKTRLWPLQLISETDDEKGEIIQLETKYMTFYRKYDGNIEFKKLLKNRDTILSVLNKQTEEHMKKQKQKQKHSEIQNAMQQGMKDHYERALRLKVINDYGSDIIFEIETEDKRNKYKYNVEKIGFKYGNVKDVAVYLGGNNEWILLRNIYDIKTNEFVKYYALDDNISYEKKVKNKLNKIKIQIINTYKCDNQYKTCFYFKIIVYLSNLYLKL
eukprot:277497_1